MTGKKASQSLQKGSDLNQDLRKAAKTLKFTEKQATAILDMRLYKLIGLEIDALMKEHEETMKNIARYEDT